MLAIRVRFCSLVVVFEHPFPSSFSSGGRGYAPLLASKLSLLSFNLWLASVKDEGAIRFLRTSTLRFQYSPHRCRSVHLLELRPWRIKRRFSLFEVLWGVPVPKAMVWGVFWGGEVVHAAHVLLSLPGVILRA